MVWRFVRAGNNKNKDKGNRFVVTPFGLHSCLRQSGGRCAAGFERPKAKALGYPEAKTKARAGWVRFYIPFIAVELR
jgi:hypothetical protein